MSAVSSVAHPLPLSGTDPALFEACLDYLYTGEKGAEGVAVLFDGFGDRVRENESEVDGTIKLREVSLLLLLRGAGESSLGADWDRRCAFNATRTSTTPGAVNCSST